VYLGIPSELLIFFYDKVIMVEMNGVVISKSDRQRESIFYENLSK